MKKIIKRIYKTILYKLPKSVGRKILYFQRMKRKLNLKNPQDLNEKINWLIVNEYNKMHGELADKYKVREYVSKKGYSNILPKLYGIYEDANDIDFNKLPKNFVLKPNNGCGHIFVFTNKEKINKDKCIKELNLAIKRNFAKESLEYHYSFIEPKIICEQYLDDGENELPLDYKFFCFDGKANCIQLCSDRNGKNYRDFYDLNGNKLNYSLKDRRSNKEFVVPKNFDKMIEIANSLSKGFKFVRVDLYNIKGKIFFGELTFSPCAGFNKYVTQEALDYLGSLIDLENK